MPQKIDVHTHFLTPAYRAACMENGHANPDGMPYLPDWSESAQLALMEKTGIKKSIISVSTPGTNLVYKDPDLAAKVTRESNSYAADLKRRIPDKIGYFASLPIPDVDLCLEEIERCEKEGCDGFVLLTNGHGQYLGDPIFDPIFDELNKRKAVLFIHPTTACIKCTDPALIRATNANAEKPTKATPLLGKFPNPMLEFLFDTARVVSNLFLSGTIRRCPDLRIILPHLGGASPPLLSRWTGFSTLVGMSGWQSTTQEEAREAFNRQFWFDMAGFPFPGDERERKKGEGGQIVGLLKGAGVEHTRLLYGSDFPYTKAEGVEFLLRQMDEGMQAMFGKEEVEDMYHRNAEELFGLAP